MSTFNVGSTPIADVKMGNAQASEVYQGNTKVWPPTPTGTSMTGMVAMFNTVTLPSGWVLCDGLNGTRNLVDSFVIGAGSSYSTGATGGSNTAQVENTPLHGHTGTVSTAPTHTHGITGVGGNHSHGTATAEDAGHSHNYVGHGATTASFANQFANYDAVQSTTQVATNTFPTEAAHAATASVAANHSHSTMDLAGSMGVHGHFASSNSSGNSSPHENRPPYYALVYAQGQAGSLPQAGMIGWTESAVPTGWVACNATNLPNLLDRFVVGSSGTYALGGVGGANAVGLDTNTNPFHSHGITMGDDNVGHFHNLNTVGHTHTVNLSAHASHGHNYDRQNVVTITVGGNTGATIRATPAAQVTIAAASAAHTMSWPAVSDFHNHTGGSAAAAHSHTINSGNAGSGSAHENRPPYRAATMIRKTDAATTIPTGVHLWYNGSTAPSGWSVAANYYDRFLVGAGSSYAVGATGGANAVSISVSEMAVHTHSATSTSDGGHSHEVASPSSTAHDHSGSAAHNANHDHGIQVSGANALKVAGTAVTAMTTSATRTTAPTNHGHTTSASSDNSSHQHNVLSGGDHSHNASFDQNQGGSAHENRPPYVALLPIVKV